MQRFAISDLNRIRRTLNSHVFLAIVLAKQLPPTELAPTLCCVSEIEPPELARLVDFAERPRVQDWSLRAALVRYAQPEPERTQQILELVRRIEFALRPHRKAIERGGPQIWSELQEDAGQAGEHAEVVALLRPVVELDRLGEVLAEWAVDLAGERPDAEVDAVTSAVARQLDELGVQREEQRPRPGSAPPGRGRRGRG